MKNDDNISSKYRIPIVFASYVPGRRILARRDFRGIKDSFGYHNPRTGSSLLTSPWSSTCLIGYGYWQQFINHFPSNFVAAGSTHTERAKTGLGEPLHGRFFMSQTAGLSKKKILNLSSTRALVHACLRFWDVTLRGGN